MKFVRPGLLALFGAVLTHMGPAYAAPAEIGITFKRTINVAETVSVLNCDNTGSTISFEGNQINLGSVNVKVALSNNFKGTKSVSIADDSYPIVAVPESGFLPINKQPAVQYGGVGGNPYIRLAPPSSGSDGFVRSDYTVNLGRCVTPSSKNISDTSEVLGEATLVLSGLECKVSSTKLNHSARSRTNPPKGSLMFSNNDQFAVHDTTGDVLVTLQVDTSNGFESNHAGVKGSKVGGNPMILIQIQDNPNIASRLKNPNVTLVPVAAPDGSPMGLFMPIGRCKDLM